MYIYTYIYIASRPAWQPAEGTKRLVLTHTDLQYLHTHTYRHIFTQTVRISVAHEPYIYTYTYAYIHIYIASRPAWPPAEEGTKALETMSNWPANSLFGILVHTLIFTHAHTDTHRQFIYQEHTRHTHRYMYIYMYIYIYIYIYI